MKEPGVFDDSVREEVPFHLQPGIGVVISGEPDLAESEHLTAANQAADIFAPTKFGAPVVGPLIDLLRRLGRPFVKLVLGSELGRQREFNAQSVRHMNVLGNRLEQRVRQLEEAIEVWSANPGGIDARVRKGLHDYDAALRQRHMTLFSALEEEVLVAHNAAAGLQALEAQFVERAQAIDQRFAEKDNVLNQEVAALRKGEGELRGAVERMEGQVGEVMALRSLLHKALQSGAPAAPATTGSSAGGEVAAAPQGEPSTWSELGEWMGDEDYRAFQDRFRGEPEVIAERMRDHVGRFAAAPGVVVDLGCGRGEFLDLLQAAGIAAVGVEINAADVEECRQRGHTAEVADLFEWLGAQDDGSLGGIFMAQVIEHLPPTDWQRFVELSASKLMGGARLVVETINPESLYALARAYVIDPTHIRPVHPELLAFLARRAGLHPVDIDYQSPVPDDERPGGLAFFRDPPAAGLTEELAALKEALVRLDRICCAPQEYTLQATRPDFGAAS
jgi:SAM-dependent methyltransferase